MKVMKEAGDQRCEHNLFFFVLGYSATHLSLTMSPYPLPIFESKWQRLQVRQQLVDAHQLRLATGSTCHTLVNASPPSSSHRRWYIVSGGSIFL